MFTEKIVECLKNEEFGVSPEDDERMNSVVCPVQLMCSLLSEWHPLILIS